MTENKTIPGEQEEKPKFDPNFNPYNDWFDWNEEDPWLGVNVDFDYVKMALPKPPTPKDGGEPVWNQGFYWMYPCPNPDAPVLITFAGGPGCTVLPKAWGYINPLDINREKRCLFKNPDSIGDRYHLIYVESPCGAGFSIDSPKTQVDNYEVLKENVKEVVGHIIKKHPAIKNNTWYICGESYCGIQVPIIYEALSDDMKLNFNGIILQSAIFSPGQAIETKYRYALMDEHDLWGGFCHKCCCKCCLGYGMCLKNAGCIGTGTWELCVFFPMLRHMKGDCKTKTEMHDDEPLSVWEKCPINVYQEKLPAEEMTLDRRIKWFLTCDKFLDLIGSKTKRRKDCETDSIPIMEKKDANVTTNHIMEKIVKKDMHILLTGGEGDYLVPWPTTIEQMRLWGLPTEFEVAPWDDKESDEYLVKRTGKLTWKRIRRSGHLMYNDRPEMQRQVITDFLDGIHNKE